MQRIVSTLACAIAVGIVAPPGAHAADPRSALTYFSGDWSCAGTAWRFAPLLADGNWLRIAYGNSAKPDGNAVAGYVTGLNKYVYRDFHADGSYADLTSDAPVDGRWTWVGPYYPVGGGMLDARISYVQIDSQRYDRIFAAITDGKLKEMGRDTCTKAPAPLPTPNR